MSRFNAMRAVFGVAAFAATLSVAQPGAATAYFFQSDSMNTSRTAHILGPNGFNDYVYIGPVKFHVFEGTGATPASGALSTGFDMVGFCVDIFHDISLGTLNLKYDDNYDLTTNSKYVTNTPFAPAATLLTRKQVVQVGRLVNYGELLYAHGPNTADTVNRLAALQGAVWHVINPDYTVVSGNAALDGYISAYSGVDYFSHLTGYGTVHAGLTFLTETGKYGTKSAHQSFAFGAVPEPASWALMIGGFGMAGAILRRSRQRRVRVKA